MHKKIVHSIILLFSASLLFADIERSYEPVIPDISYFEFRENIMSLSYLYLETGVLTDGSAEFIISSLSEGNYSQIYIMTENLKDCRSEASFTSCSQRKGKAGYDFSIHARVEEGEERIFFSEADAGVFFSFGRDSLLASVSPYLVLPEFTCDINPSLFYKRSFGDKFINAGSSYLNLSDLQGSQISASLSSGQIEAGIFFYRRFFPKFKARAFFPDNGYASFSIDFERKGEESYVSIFNPLSYYSEIYRAHSFLSASAALRLGSFSISAEGLCDIDSLSGYADLDLTAYDISAGYSAFIRNSSLSVSLHSLSGRYYQVDCAEVNAEIPAGRSLKLILNCSPAYYRGAFFVPASVFLLFGESSVQAAAGIENIFSQENPVEQLYSPSRSFSLRLILKDASIFNHY